MGGMFTNPMAQLASQGIQNQALQAQIGFQNFMDNAMRAYSSIAQSPTNQNAAINYLQGTPQGVGGLTGSLLANMNAANAVIPGGYSNPAVSNQILGALQPSLNQEAANAFYTSLGLPFGAKVQTPQTTSAQNIPSGLSSAAQSIGSAMALNNQGQSSYPFPSVTPGGGQGAVYFGGQSTTPVIPSF